MIELRKFAVLTLCSALAMGFAACSDDDYNNGGPVVDPPTSVVTPTEGVTVEGYYKGDIYDASTGNLWINFISDDLQWDDFDEDYTGTGNLICLDFNTTLASNPDFATLADGEYKTDTDGNHAEFTVNVSDGDSYVVKYVNSTATEYEVTAAELTVLTDGEYKVIKGKLTLDDGSVDDFEYVGEISIINRTGEGNMSNLEGDVTVAGLTQGVAIYYGETFTETSDLYMVVIAGEDYDLDENYGNAPCVWLAVNVTPGSNTGIPTGTYNLIDAMDADDYEVGSALSGVYEESLGGFFGTWYFHTLAAQEASMQSGTINVVNNGDGTYKITFDLKDGYGHSVKGTYNGALSLEDWSE
ncbi:MAG: hypothetical protein NC111_00580 [Bacteroides sp.]|nr:hypothetical protein [Bacteroides sp.]MCM1414147.1 hypothetical protein [Bacteroides sp.]MCM1471013.1 hypothetical protein [Bacteroides sp.]